jgi:hypothetical protein
MHSIDIIITCYILSMFCYDLSLKCNDPTLYELSKKDTRAISNALENHEAADPEVIIVHSHI